MYLCIFFEQTKTKAEIKQNSRHCNATPSFRNDLWVPDSLHLNHFPRGTLKSFPVTLDFGGWLKVKMSKAFGLHPRMLPDDCEKWPYAALIIQGGGCCKACPDGCLGQRGKSRMMRTWEWSADAKKTQKNKKPKKTTPFCWSHRLGSNFCISVTASKVWKEKAGFSAKAPWTQQLTLHSSAHILQREREMRQAQETGRRWERSTHQPPGTGWGTCRFCDPTDPNSSWSWDRTRALNLWISSDV